MHFHSRKCIWKWGHFVSASMCQTPNFYTGVFPKFTLTQKICFTMQIWLVGTQKYLQYLDSLMIMFPVHCPICLQDPILKMSRAPCSSLPSSSLFVWKLHAIHVLRGSHKWPVLSQTGCKINIMDQAFCWTSANLFIINIPCYIMMNEISTGENTILGISLLWIKMRFGPVKTCLICICHQTSHKRHTK